ncbi:NTP transferase domain-containing protein [Calidifontibacter sp. DB0510]|uniref:NTP transferase domain-containing protein n=1 Tax=Metallococcus carri TaxID=1656884 RepID=A0A967B4A9_9MICO|nr:NTP transferase domain-containing protein [Metallococcus carri]NHN57025.1 NTP transferase domain-containing protein [Metallococcus carri]NOP39106.1 NTP transferase domain-containing protein [Calidifontibacter sp. DB2511S]
MVTAIVLCGGRARRFGADKLAARLPGGRTVLDATLAGVPASWPVVCVGAERPVQRAVRWVEEAEPFGGPLAGLAAGLAVVEDPVCVVLGGDMPYAGRALPVLVAPLSLVEDHPPVAGRARPSLVERAQRVETTPNSPNAAIAVTDRRQPLLAAYRTDALRRALPSEVSGAPMRRLWDALDLVEVTVDERAAYDIDTVGDLRAFPAD